MWYYIYRKGDVKMDDLELYQLLGLEEDYIKFQNEMKDSIELFKFIVGDDE